MIAMKSFGLSALIAIAAISSCYAQVRAGFLLQLPRSGGFVAAHRTLPIGARVKVTNLKNGRVATVVIIGRGPFARGRIIDVSTEVADLLQFRQSGAARVKIEVAQR
jgi:Lytic transglycolase